MTLEPEERTAGYLFRDTEQGLLDELNAAQPPTFVVPHLLALYRHCCPAREMRSTSLELKEIYHSSPRIAVESDDGVHTAFWYDTWCPARVSQVDTWMVHAGRFGWIYRDGRCRGCTQTARSTTGRLVDGWDRPPIARS